MIRLTDPTRIAAFISDLRILNQITQHALAAESGHRQGQISAWELGKVIPNVVPLMDVARVLGYDLALIPREDA
jgi:transcriptional regulator with XRE-family HTH domain